MKPRRFSSDDGAFRVHLEADSLRALYRFAGEGGRLETGGLLIGAYSEGLHCAVVTEITGPPPDSRRFRTRFERGTQGVPALLKRRWQAKGRRTYYLGEWHLHPGAPPKPSRQDRTQMQAFAEDPQACPEPILLLVGGSRQKGWQLGVYLFRSGTETPLELTEEVPAP